MPKTSLFRFAGFAAVVLFAACSTACSTKMPGEWQQLNTGTADAFYSVNFVNDRVGFINAVADRDYVPLGDEAAALANQNSNPNSNQKANNSNTQPKKPDPLKANEGFEVLKTTDGGETWNQLPEQFKHRIRSVWFVDEQNGWGLTIDRNILRTTDGGATWAQQRKAGKVNIKLTANRRQPVSEQPEQLERLHFADLNHGWAWGGGRHDEFAEQPGIFLTTIDGGQNWNEIKYPFAQQVWSIFFLNPQAAWANTPDGSLYRTADGGLNWAKIDTKLPEDRLDCLFFLDEQNGWLITHGGGRLAKTTDGGKTWARQGHIKREYVMRDLFFTDKDHGWAVGDNGVILYTDDGGKNWVFANPLGAVSYRDVLFINKDKGWVIGLDGAILRHD